MMYLRLVKDENGIALAANEARYVRADVLTEFFIGQADGKFYVDGYNPADPDSFYILGEFDTFEEAKASFEDFAKCSLEFKPQR